jgi:hypothetical protein
LHVFYALHKGLNGGNYGLILSIFTVLASNRPIKIPTLRKNQNPKQFSEKSKPPIDQPTPKTQTHGNPINQH